MGENWIFGSKFKDFFKRWRFNRTLHYFRIILEASKGYVKNSPAWKDRLGGSSGSFLLVGKLEAFHEGLLLYSGEAIWSSYSGCLSVTYHEIIHLLRCFKNSRND